MSTSREFPIDPSIATMRSLFDWPTFCKVTRFAPHKGQIPVMEAIQDPEVEVIVLVCGRRMGKTKVAGQIAAGFTVMPDEGGIVWAVGPTYQLAKKVYREADLTIHRHFGTLIPNGGDHPAEMNIQVSHPDWKGNVAPNELWGKSSESPEQLLGEGLRLAILDEAARMGPDIWNYYISPALEERHGLSIIVTTPRGKGHWTYPLWRSGRNASNSGPATEGPVRSYRFPSWVNPLIDRTRVEQRLKEGRMTLRSYMENYCAEFLDDGGSVFHEVRSRAVMDRKGPEPGMQYSIGADLAKYEDFSVFTVMSRKKEVVHVERLPHVEWHLQETKMIELARRYNRARIVIDASGVGDPVAETIMRKCGGIPVLPFKYTGNSKKELIDHLVILFERKEISILKYDLFPDMVDELEAFEYVLSKARRIKMEAPSGAHDDCVNSLALAAWAWKTRTNRPISLIRPRIQISSSYGGRQTHDIRR